MPHLKNHDLWTSFTTVFRQPRYLLLAILITLLILFVAIWLPNIPLLRYTLGSEVYSRGEKLNILWQSLGAIKTNFTLLSRTFTILIALLSGINISLFVFYLKKRMHAERVAGTSLLGMTIGMLGVGCASCGSVVLSSIFGLTATASIIGLLPLGGSEFGIVGIVLLLWSNNTLAKKINNPLSCTLPHK